MCIIWEAKVFWNYSVHDFSWKWGLSSIIILQLWVLPRPCISSMICDTLYTSIPSLLEWPRFYIAIYLLLSSIFNKQCLSSLCLIFSTFHVSVPMFKLFWMGSSILDDISTTFPSFFDAYLLCFDSDMSTFLVEVFSLGLLCPSFISCNNIARLSIYFCNWSILSFIALSLASLAISPQGHSLIFILNSFLFRSLFPLDHI